MIKWLRCWFRALITCVLQWWHSTYPWCLDEPEGDAPHRVRWSCSHHSWWCRHWCDPWSNIRRLYTQRCLLEYRQAHTRRTMWCKGNREKYSHNFLEHHFYNKKLLSPITIYTHLKTRLIMNSIKKLSNIFFIAKNRECRVCKLVSVCKRACVFETQKVR